MPKAAHSASAMDGASNSGMTSKIEVASAPRRLADAYDFMRAQPLVHVNRGGRQVAHGKSHAAHAQAQHFALAATHRADRAIGELDKATRVAQRRKRGGQGVAA